MFCFSQLRKSQRIPSNSYVCNSKTYSIISFKKIQTALRHATNLIRLNIVVGIIWSDTQKRDTKDHNNPWAQPSQLHLVTRKPSGDTCDEDLGNIQNGAE